MIIPMNKYKFWGLLSLIGNGISISLVVCYSPILFFIPIFFNVAMFLPLAISLINDDKWPEISFKEKGD